MLTTGSTSNSIDKQVLRHQLMSVSLFCFETQTLQLYVVIRMNQPSSLDHSLSGQLITSINITVCARSERIRARISDATILLSVFLVCSTDTLSLPCQLESQDKYGLLLCSVRKLSAQSGKQCCLCRFC